MADERETNKDSQRQRELERVRQAQQRDQLKSRVDRVRDMMRTHRNDRRS